eukprot:scaffold4216_cov389-Prasinococcus_capsulatus_cf.AAC.5
MPRCSECVVASISQFGERLTAVGGTSTTIVWMVCAPGMSKTFTRQSIDALTSHRPSSLNVISVTRSSCPNQNIANTVDERTL